MEEINIEKIKLEINEAIDELGNRFTDKRHMETNSFIQQLTLKNKRVCQIHVKVTCDQDEFFEV